MTTAELLQALRDWVATQAPGLVPSHVAIHFHNHAVPFQLPLGPVAVPKLPEEASGGEELSPVIVDILQVLREVKRPLSQTRIREELSKRGKHYNARTIAGHLAALVQDGTLENPGPPKGGYRLPPEDET